MGRPISMRPGGLSGLYSVARFLGAKLSADWLNCVAILTALLRHDQDNRTVFGSVLQGVDLCR
jgi:hypothetical protein